MEDYLRGIILYGHKSLSFRTDPQMMNIIKQQQQ